jgi:hypothetical protein
MANGYTFGDKLQGIGAVLGGTVPQFQKQMGELSAERQKAMYQDADAALKMATRGDLPGVISLIEDRINMIQRLNGDPTESLQALNFARAAQSGDVAAGDKLMQGLTMSQKRGIDLGFIAPPAAPKYLGTEEGIILTQSPSGEIQRTELYDQEGAGGNGQTYQQRQAWKELRKDFKSGSDAVSNNAKTVLEEYGKVEGLINQATDKNVDDRSRRQAAATLVTVLARMASPGVVTDRDFINFSGGLAARGGDFALFKDYLSGKGLDDTILASIDPMNPDGFSREGMLALANNLVIPAGRTLLGTFASQMSSAKEYNPAEFEMRATFSPNNPNIKKLGEIAFEGFNMRDYYSNPESYVTEMRQQSQQAAPQSQQPQQMMPPPGTTIYSNYEAAADAAQSMAIGDVIHYWDGEKIRSEELE